MIAMFGFNTNEQVKNAILELAHRKIRQMVKTDSVADYCFTSYDLPEGHQGGYEAYMLLRNAIT